MLMPTEERMKGGVFLAQVIHCFALASKIKSWHFIMQFPEMLSETCQNMYYVTLLKGVNFEVNFSFMFMCLFSLFSFNIPRDTSNFRVISLNQILLNNLSRHYGQENRTDQTSEVTGSGVLWYVTNCAGFHMILSC